MNLKINPVRELKKTHINRKYRNMNRKLVNSLIIGNKK